MPNIAFISDTHGRHYQLKQMPEADVLVHAGDLSMTGEASVLNSFNNWLEEYCSHYKYIVVVPGNHDFHFQNRKSILTNATHILMDEAAEIEGLKFYGSPFTPQYGDWAFMLPRGESIYQKWVKIPHDTDVLITHGPPWGILDQAVPASKVEVAGSEYSRSGSTHAGCADLLTVVQGIQPKVHVFGHIHGSSGMVRFDKTTFINAAVVNEHYNVVNPPIVMEVK